MAFEKVVTTLDTDTLPDGFDKVNRNWDVLTSTSTGEGATMVSVRSGSGLPGATVQAALEGLDSQDSTLQTNIDAKEDYLGTDTGNFLLRADRTWQDPADLGGGGGDVSSVNSQTPDGGGNVTLTATNIGRSASAEISATNVEAALGEIYSEKVSLTDLASEATGSYGASLVGVDDTAGFTDSSNVEACLIHILTRLKGSRLGNQSYSNLANSITVNRLSISLAPTTGGTITAASLFDVTNLPDGLNNGDTLELFNNSTRTLTLDTTYGAVSTASGIYIWDDETGRSTFNIEPYRSYTFMYDSTWGYWYLDREHIEAEATGLKIVDSGTLFSNTNGTSAWDVKTVETALAEVKTQANTNTTDIATNTADIASLGADVTTLTNGCVYNLLSSINIDIGFTSTSSYIPTNQGGIRIHSHVDCFIEFGDSNVTANGTKSIYFPAGTETFGIPSGATHIAVKSAGMLGVLNVSALDGTCNNLTTNKVLSYAAGSTAIELPSGTRVRIFATTDCYIKFGTLTVDASNGAYFEAGAEILSIPTATHIAARRYTTDGGLYVSGIEQ